MRAVAPTATPRPARAAGAYRSARALLGTNYAHALVVEVPVGTAVLDRGVAELLGDALSGLGDERALQLMGVFAPGLTLEDVRTVRRAIELFEEEMAIEDRRPEPRTWRERVGKTLAI